ncbi:hypothetical protein ABI_09530 [Asticcacaulis biprosthecium C19]|uniref:Uncharacterized protein n=1 Tax=Asticcacaulis biprosthecium C19 TaxID=715226 RepID=F4QGR4_9CAUL|nr:hypothetical protein [Asticcacaulis biprosthecium]EGF92516.1 hypothetical protein ABI_09530 [Asticcacaulis biprosthecium C19]
MPGTVPDDRIIDAADGAVHDAVPDVIEAADGREIEAASTDPDEDHLRGGRPVPAHLAAQTAAQASAQAVATTTADPEASTSHDAVPRKDPVENAVAEPAPAETAPDLAPEAPNNPYLAPDDPDPVTTDDAGDAAGE